MAKPYISQLATCAKNNDLKDLEEFINDKFDDKFWESVSDVESKYPDFLSYQEKQSGFDYEWLFCKINYGLHIHEKAPKGWYRETPF